MTTDELIGEIKSLRPSERDAVLNMLLELKSTESIDYVDDESFDRATEGVLTRHAELMRKLAQ